MTRKSKIFYFTILAVNLLCFIVDCFHLVGNFSFFRRVSFPLSLTLIGLMLLIRAISLKIDSSMFFGIAFLGCGIINFVINFTKIPMVYIYPYYIYSFALASLVTGSMFKDKVQFKFFILFLVAGSLVLLFSYKVINLIWLIVLEIVWLICYFLYNIIMTKRRNRNG